VERSHNWPDITDWRIQKWRIEEWRIWSIFSRRLIWRVRFCLGISLEFHW
jgi:hypothetical protein